MKCIDNFFYLRLTIAAPRGWYSIAKELTLENKDKLGNKSYAR